MLRQALGTICRWGGRIAAFVASVLRGIFTLIVVLCIVAAQQLPRRLPLPHALPMKRIVRKPRFEAMVRDDVDLYSTDQLRAEYHAAQGGYDTLIRLRNSNISREEIAAEIRWRICREDRRFWLLAVMSFLAALAGCASVVLVALSRCA